MPSTRSVVVVKQRADGNGAAIARQGDSATAVVIGCFSIDVAADVIPGRAIPLVDAGVARIRAVGSVLRCSDIHD